MHFGVREFAMCAIANGLALHGGFIPYVGTFLTFSDYARNALRMAALMKLRSIFVFTHDSIGLGEDGPTHQSVEHTASLRLIPHLDVWRPCDTVETAVAWVAAIEREDGPTALVLTRQNVPFQPRDARQIADIRRGGYVLADFAGTAGARRVVIIAHRIGDLARRWGARRARRRGHRCARRLAALHQRLRAAGRGLSRERAPAGVPRVAVEAGVTGGWRAYVGAADDPRGAVVGIDRFGESAPAAVLFKHFGFTVEAVVAAAQAIEVADAVMQDVA